MKSVKTLTPSVTSGSESTNLILILSVTSKPESLEIVSELTDGQEVEFEELTLVVKVEVV